MRVVQIVMSNFIRKKVRFSVGSPVKVVRGVCRALESRIMSKNRWIVDETEYYRAYHRTSTEKMAYDPDNQRPTPSSVLVVQVC